MNIQVGSRISVPFQLPNGSWVTLKGTAQFFNPITKKWTIKRLRFAAVSGARTLACNMPSEVNVSESDMGLKVTRV